MIIGLILGLILLLGLMLIGIGAAVGGIILTILSAKKKGWKKPLKALAIMASSLLIILGVAATIPGVSMGVLIGEQVVSDIQYNGSLTEAVWQNNIETARIKLKKGADPNENIKFHNTPLEAAIWNGSYEMAELLVGYGADVSSALWSAAYHKEISIVNLLLENKADPNFPTQVYDGEEYPLFGAIASYDDECLGLSIIEVLLTYGADINSTNGEGDTVLDCVNDSDWNLGETPEYREEVVEFLVANGAKMSKDL